MKTLDIKQSSNQENKFTVDSSVGHSLKVLPEYYKEIVNGKKTFEIRKNDRKYQVGDKLILKEWDGENYTGNITKKEITYILDDNSGFVLTGYVVMSIK